MLGSWLFWLTATATVLLVPAMVALLRVDRYTHKAEPRGLTRQVGLVAATTSVAVAALLVVALLGAGDLGAVLVALVVGGSILESARGRDDWAVRGIVTRGLLLAGTVSGLLWLGDRVISPQGSALGGLLLGGAWGFAVWGAVRVRHSAERWLGARAALDGTVVHGVGPVARSSGRPPLRRTAVALAAFVVPAAAVAAIAGGRPAPDPAPPSPQAGAGEAPGRSTAPGSGPTSGSPAMTGTGRATTPSQRSGRPRPKAEPTGDATPAPQSVETPADSSPWETTAPTESPSPSGAGLPTVIPIPTGWPEESKTPGYAKEKPNRPSDAPSPGSGKD